MSMFLGPIHHWLYGKIEKQEALTEVVAHYAQANGLIEDGAVYTKVLLPLEEAIDETNIHGWLQGTINDAESRFAEMIEAINANEDHLEEICDVAYDFGKQHALPADVTAAEAYQEFDSFFVNGMPCDMVNIVRENSEDRVEWEMAQDIHAGYWTNAEGSAPYYRIRKSVMDGMVAGTGLEVSMSDDHCSFVLKK